MLAVLVQFKGESFSGPFTFSALFSARSPRPFSLIDIVWFIDAAFLVVGLFTQAAALAAIILIAFRWYTEWRAGTQSVGRMLLYKMLVVVAFALLFLGAGFLAFDLPL